MNADTTVTARTGPGEQLDGRGRHTDPAGGTRNPATSRGLRAATRVGIPDRAAQRLSGRR